MEHLAREAVKQFIIAHQNEFVAGLVHFGQQRRIKQVTKSAVTPPHSYYFIAVFTERRDKRQQVDGVNEIYFLPKRDEYQVTIAIIDYINGVRGEDQLYEAMDEGFQILGDRIMDAIDEAVVFTLPNAQFKLTENTEISKVNRPTFWGDAENYEALLECEISFSIYGC